MIERKRGNRLYLEYFDKGSQSSEKYIFFNFPLDGILNISILYFQVVLNIFHFGFIYIPLHFRPHSCRVGARDISLRNSISDFSEIISDHRKGISIVWEIFLWLSLKWSESFHQTAVNLLPSSGTVFFSISFALLTFKYCEFYVFMKIYQK